ncbi:hypothetical protein [Amycolatopsis sp. DG1A-15b]|uniref:hypothetical protein n=1 Tax=Amycolatopsis sp. DG1A-15b TaxID=3052846 RepID=UPI00255B711C|nr:hypothetical protein [Amycolatopsis sp. DG1A-15b]WIX84520.1 hypothetical protein QRY02_25020 [Amycolatopsis sp. DG1A-15b]
MTTSHHPPNNHLSAAERQRTCAACGRPFEPGDRTGLEVFLDGEVHYAAVHDSCSTYPAARESTIAGKLRRMRTSEAA